MFFRLMLVACVVLMMSFSVAAQEDEFVFGVILIGSESDRGWSQSHFEAGRYVEERAENTRMLLFSGLNDADSPGTTLLDVVSDMVDQGAEVIFTTSSSLMSTTDDVAANYPDVVFINLAGDEALTGDAAENVGNLMGQMEWGQLIAGCAAGLTTESGKIGYVSSIENAETRRLSSSAFLGARYCYEHYKGGVPEALTFNVTWIGYWFYLPGVSLNPADVVNQYFNDGVDVVISGIDTTEPLTVAQERRENGEDVAAILYDFRNACEVAPDACLGSAYFNWGPAYLDLVEAVRADRWQQDWLWLGPDWGDINDSDASIVGFEVGEALSRANRRHLNAFIADLGAYATNPLTPKNEFGIKSIALWEGPLSLADGTELASPGQIVDALDVFYLDQLLSGMVGTSDSE